MRSFIFRFVSSPRNFHPWFIIHIQTQFYFFMLARSLWQLIIVLIKHAFRRRMVVLNRKEVHDSVSYVCVYNDKAATRTQLSIHIVSTHFFLTSWLATIDGGLRSEVNPSPLNFLWLFSRIFEYYKPIKCWRWRITNEERDWGWNIHIFYTQMWLLIP